MTVFIDRATHGTTKYTYGDLIVWHREAPDLRENPDRFTVYRMAPTKTPADELNRHYWENH